MNINEARSPGRCQKCGMTKMGIDGVMACPNCSTENVPKTGRTIVVTEPSGVNGPAKVEFVTTGNPLPPVAAQVAPVLVGAPGTISVNVPVALFADLVVWSRKLKVPKKWEDVEKMRAILDFQCELFSKLKQ